MYDYSKLRGRIVEKFGSCKVFFEKVGIHPVNGSRKLNGKTPFSQDDMVLWSKILELDLTDIGPYFCAIKY